ncbi:MAG TPA: hypothetical protein P5314_09260 [Tetrasphaera sp.]|nr:hypothetical protein [Tetrasphaera sp.]
MTGAVAGAATAVLTRLLRTRPPGGGARWTRTNHAGRPISLLEGPGYVAGSALGLAAAALASPRRQTGMGSVAAGLVAGVGAGAAGLLDDLAGDSASKGLRGHLGALRQGRVTTGALKIAGIGASGLVGAALVDRDAGRRLGPATLVGGAVIAGSANLANLLDLRPGRALKATVLGGIPLALLGESAAASAVGAALGSLPADLRGETMLGDTGANAAGALVGTALVARSGPLGRGVALAVLTALTLASERVSFTRVIESTPVLRDLDAWGRP